MSKILLIGGSGILGTELRKLNPDLIAPSHEEVNINYLAHIEEYLHRIKPEIIIHCAAETDNRKIEKYPFDAIETNIVGTAYLSMVCCDLNIRLVYISTDYCYQGVRGGYSEGDEVLPTNLYAWLKLGGECSVKAVKNHLIIRTSFGKNTFDYPNAFIDKWTSKDYVDVIAPMIYEASLSPLTGVLNLGTERKTIFAHAKERNPNVNPVKIEDTAFLTPYDTSLNMQKWVNYKSSKSMAKAHTNCRICDSANLIKYLDLGLMPLANALEFTAIRAKEKEKFPLQVMFCADCGLSQLSVVIDPEKMFSYYTYRSSVNAPYVLHCRDMAKYCLKNYYLANYNSFVIDLASNDGALLAEFKDVVIGLKVLGVDPASNLVAIAEQRGIETIADFWSVDVARRILKSHGKADLITATNVFAHVDSVKEFIDAVSIVLKENGVLIIECPYVVDFIENMEYSQCYFEHLSIMSVIPMDVLCKSKSMRIINVEKFDIHTGTIRVTITHRYSELKTKPSVAEFIGRELEQGFSTIEKFADWSDKVSQVNREFETKILELKRSGAKIAGFGASAKGNALLNRAGMTTDIIDYICDETPEKLSKFASGTAIPIVNKQQLLKSPPDYLIILSWNFAEAIMKKCRDIGYVGKFIIPIPSFTIID